MRLTRAHLATAAVAAVYLCYFVLLIHCDLWRPQAEGIEFDFAGPRMILTEVVAGSPASRAGLRIGDEVTASDGHPIDSRLDWVSVENNYVIGKAVRLQVLRSGTAMDVPLDLGREPPAYWRSGPGASLLFVRIVQAITLGFAILIAWRSANDVAAAIGAWLLGTAGVFCVVLPYRFAAVWRDLPTLVGAPLWIPYVASLSMGAILFTFFQLFPRRALHGWWAWALAWTPIVLAGAPRVAHEFRVVYRPQAMTTAPNVMVAMIVVSLAYLAATMMLSVRRYRQLEDVNERRRIQVLVLGSAVGCAAAGPLVVRYWMFGSAPSLFANPLNVAGTFALLVVPVSFTYAILRHRLFGVRLIIRRGVQYVLARGVLLALVPATAAVFLGDLVLHRAQPFAAMLHARLWAYLLLAGFAIGASIRRKRWLDALDRRFFREHYDARRLLTGMVDDVRSGGTLADLAPRVVARIDAALHPTWTTLAVRRAQDGPFVALAALPRKADAPPLEPDGAMLGILRATGRPIDLGTAGATWLEDRVPAGEWTPIRSAGVDLIVPVTLGPGRDEIVLLLGARRSEEPYSGEDVGLLTGVAGSLALLAERTGTSPPPTPAPAGECPSCGTCHDAPALRCESDGSELVRLRVPRLLNGRYRLERRIGRGGMGTVFAATDTALDRTVALKLIRDDLAAHRLVLDRFQAEARVAAAFSHPNVVTIHDVGVAEGVQAFLVMELLPGRSLREHLRECGRFDAARALGVLSGIASAVDSAHRRHIVHRDLKPENVLLVPSDEGEVAKVLDFGIARILAPEPADGAGAATTFGVLVGTPLYMAPERLRGEAPTAGWDLWALAVIAFELLTGSHPFAGVIGGGLGTGPSGHVNGAGRPDVPADWQAFFDEALAVDPLRRPATARELVAGLERAVRPTRP